MQGNRLLTILAALLLGIAIVSQSLQIVDHVHLDSASDIACEFCQQASTHDALPSNPHNDWPAAKAILAATDVVGAQSHFPTPHRARGPPILL